MRRRLRLLFLVAVGIVVIGVIGVLLYVRFADLSVHRGTVEDLLSDATGREFRIAGTFEPSIGLTSRIVAEDVTLANPDWASEPDMVRVGRLEGTIRLLSLMSGPIEIHDLTIENARVVVEQHDTHGSNWVFDTGKEPDPDAEPTVIPEIVLGTLSVRGVEYVLRDPSGNETIRTDVSNLQVRSDDTGMLELDLTGTFNDRDVRLSGTAGTLNDLIRVGPARFDVSGRIDDIAVDLTASVSDLAAIEGLEGSARVEGPELSRIAELAGLPSQVQGPFEIEAGVVPAEGESNVTIRAKLAGANVDATASLDSVMSPGSIDARIEASGPDLDAVVAPFGVTDLPRRPFTVSGGAHWAGFPMTFDAVELVVGDHRATADGILGAPPLMLESDLRVHAEGPGLDEFEAIAAIDLPPGRFRLDANLVRSQDALDIREFDASIGEISLHMVGTLGDPPEYRKTDLELAISAPDLSVVSDLVGYDLPPEALRVQGHVRERDSALALDAVRATMGRNTLRAEGVFGLLEGYAGTDLRIRVAGPDLSDFSALEDVPDLPSEAYDVDTRIRVRAGDRGYRVEPLDVRLGDITLHAEGIVGPLPDPVGTDLAVRIAGPDLAHVGSLADYAPLPAEPFEVRGGIGAIASGYELRELFARVGEIEATVDGHVGSIPELAGTRVRIDAGGPTVAAIGGFVADAPPLPDAPFSVTGTVAVEPDGYGLEPVTVVLGTTRVTATGTVVAETGLAGSSLVVEVAGDDFERLGALVAVTELVEIPELPARTFSVVGGVDVSDAGYGFRELVATVGDAEVRVDGTLTSAAEFHGSDLSLSAEGPDLSWIGELAEVELPGEPFRVQGRVERRADGGRFHDVRASVGGHRAHVDGFLGEPPNLVGTNLDVAASGPSLAFLGTLAGNEDLAAVPYDVVAHFDGSPTEFTMSRFEATAGPTDLRGSVHVDLRDKPDIKGEFFSKNLDIVAIRRQKTEEEIEAARAEKSAEIESMIANEGEAEPSEESEYVISDEPIALEFLDDANLDLKLKSDQLAMRAFTLREFEIGVLLRDGTLQVFPFHGAGIHGGTATGGLTLKPAGAFHLLDAQLSVDDGRLNLTQGRDDPENWPTLDLDFSLTGTGDSAHNILASANGRAVAVVGPGLLDKSVLDLIATDFLLGFLDALNPLSKKRDRTQLECGVIVANIEDGKARINPIAVQTDAVTLGGNGRINFANENLDLEWVVKPRKGIGLSASMITNPYIKLGGTLSKPAVEVKPLEAVTSTGVAVATVGISVLARGLWDRVSSERKVCEEAIAKAEQQLAGQDSKKKKKKKNKKSAD